MQLQQKHGECVLLRRSKVGQNRQAVNDAHDAKIKRSSGEVEQRRHDAPEDDNMCSGVLYAVLR